ncbi:MAG: hypothetical protein QM734_00015 [Cyclobacteriaceae bacterium]
MKWICFLLISILVLGSFVSFSQDLTKQIDVNGLKREYIVHIPKNFDAKIKRPLVLIFHGGGGSAKRSFRFFGLNAVADTAGFLAVYPNGIDKGWNDGRKVRKHTQDDVGFIRQLIEQLNKDYLIDEKKIFATGISNGGFFSFALGLQLSDQLRAIAPVCATIPKDIYDQYNPAKPIGLLLINGTKDPLVPYDGGKVGGRWLNRGECVSTEKSIEKYLQLNHGSNQATKMIMPNPVVNDGCEATRFIYPCELNNVQLIRHRRRRSHVARRQAILRQKAYR